MLAGTFNYLFSYLILEVYKYLNGIDLSVEDNYNLIAFELLFAASTCLSVWAALKYRDWRITGWYYLVIFIAGAGAAGIAIAIAIASPTVGAGWAATWAITVCYVLFGWHLNRRAIQTEEPMLAL